MKTNPIYYIFPLMFITFSFFFQNHEQGNTKVSVTPKSKHDLLSSEAWTIHTKAAQTQEEEGNVDHLYPNYPQTHPFSPDLSPVYFINFQLFLGVKLPHNKFIVNCSFSFKTTPNLSSVGKWHQDTPKLTSSISPPFSLPTSHFLWYSPAPVAIPSFKFPPALPYHHLSPAL